MDINLNTSLCFWLLLIIFVIILWFRNEKLDRYLIAIPLFNACIGLMIYSQINGTKITRLCDMIKYLIILQLMGITVGLSMYFKNIGFLILGTVVTMIFGYTLFLINNSGNNPLSYVLGPTWMIYVLIIFLSLMIWSRNNVGLMFISAIITILYICILGFNLGLALTSYLLIIISFLFIVMGIFYSNGKYTNSSQVQ